MVELEFSQMNHLLHDYDRSLRNFDQAVLSVAVPATLTEEFRWIRVSHSQRSSLTYLLVLSPRKRLACLENAVHLCLIMHAHHSISCSS